MTNKQKLAELQKELARQDEQLAAFQSRLEDLPDISIEVADAFMREAETICAVEIERQPLVLGIRA